MKHIRIYWIPFSSKTAGQFIDVGYVNQCDFLFLNFFVITIRITKKKYRTGQYART